MTDQATGKQTLYSGIDFWTEENPWTVSYYGGYDPKTQLNYVRHCTLYYKGEYICDRSSKQGIALLEHIAKRGGRA